MASSSHAFFFHCRFGLFLGAIEAGQCVHKGGAESSYQGSIYKGRGVGPLAYYKSLCYHALLLFSSSRAQSTYVATLTNVSSLIALIVACCTELRLVIMIMS